MSLGDVRLRGLVGEGSALGGLLEESADSAEAVLSNVMVVTFALHVVEDDSIVVDPHLHIWEA